MSKIHINIGSNIGDRAALIERAVAALSESLDPDNRCVIRLAPLIESAPWGYESTNSFLNLGLMIETPGDETPESVLKTLQTVERRISDTPHRNPDGSYADRPIDIDLIAVDDKIIDTPSLQLPHPRMHMRDFVLKPIADLDPYWLHPLTGKTAKQMLDSL